jgi:hypothetical protein
MCSPCVNEKTNGYIKYNNYKENNMKRRFFSILLALLLCLSCAVTASASQNTNFGSAACR